jgi:hypothetical protein
MKLDLEFVELHSPLFLADTNFGMKLYADAKKSQKGLIKMWYDTELEHTVIVYKHHVAIIESTASKTLADPSQIGVTVQLVPQEGTIRGVKIVPLVPTQPVKAQVSGPGLGLKQSAQVSTPMDKVQGKPGRKAKYQGEESQGE